MNISHLARFIIISCITAAAVNIAAAQDGVQTRSITSDDFASQRPAKAQSAGKKNAIRKPKRFTYKFVRADKNAIRRNDAQKKSIGKPTAANLPVKITEIGVTLWKMRPPRGNESGHLLPVKGENGERKMWLAERVGADAVFKSGDKVRFAVESSASGYLYVIDRETYSDGSFGEPSLIFPALQTDDNSVKSGMLADIPDQREQWPYFKMNPKKANYTGELLTVIVSPRPLTNIKTGKDGKVTNSDELTDLEFGAEVEIFGRTDTVDKIYTKAESESSCGVKTRELEREKSSGNACGVTSRQLTRDEPLPQSIYRVKGFAGQPAVAFVKLSVH